MRLIGLVIFTILFSQHLLSQNGEVELIITPKTADVGEVLTITVKSKVHGEIDIENLPSSFVQGYEIMNGMESEMDYNTGDLITYYYISQTGAIGKAGKYTIGPAYVKQGNKSYYSNKVTVNIGDKTQMTSSDVTNQQLNDPAFGIIQTNKTSLYEGEPLLVSAKVYSKFDPTHLDNYRPYTMKGVVDAHPIGNTSRINKTEERFKGINLYAFEYDKNIIFPIGTGKFRINSFVMNLNQGLKGFMLTSSSAVVEIKPLPVNQPSDFIGAVGSFELTRTIEDGDFEQGDVFKMKIVVSGNGNIQNILEPTPMLPKGFVVYGDPIITEDIAYTSRGAEGEITYEFNIQVNKHGDLKLPPTTISYFDVLQEDYVTASTEEVEITVKRNEDFVADEVDTNDKQNLDEVLPTAELRKSEIAEQQSDLYGTSLFWTGIGVPILSALFFILFVTKREKSEEKIAVKQTVKRKDNELSEYYSELKVALAANDNNLFYSKIEATLKKAFEREMKIQDDRVLNKQEIFEYLKASNQTDLSQRVEALLNKTEQSRFGFTASEDTKQSLFDELSGILKAL